MSVKTPQNSVKIYRFLSAKWALKTLQECRLKISRLKELNDPFEWYIVSQSNTDTYERIGRDVMDGFRDRMNDRFGVICFSQRVSDPVIWSHYADSHKGIALEFAHDAAEATIKIDYSPDLPVFDAKKLVTRDYDQDYTFSVLQKSLGKKAPSWSYEEELRLHYDLDDAECEMDGDLYFTKIPDNYLKRVILGDLCTVSEDDVKRSLKQGGIQGVEIARARKSKTAFELICE